MLYYEQNKTLKVKILKKMEFSSDKMNKISNSENFFLLIQQNIFIFIKTNHSNIYFHSEKGKEKRRSLLAYIQVWKTLPSTELFV